AKSRHDRLLEHPWTCIGSCRTKWWSLPRGSVYQRLAPCLSRTKTPNHIRGTRLTWRTNVDWDLRQSEFLSHRHTRVVNRSQPIRSTHDIDWIPVPSPFTHTLPQSVCSSTPASSVLTKSKLVWIDRTAVVYQYRSVTRDHIV